MINKVITEIYNINLSIFKHFIKTYKMFWWCFKDGNTIYDIKYYDLFNNPKNLEKLNKAQDELERTGQSQIIKTEEGLICEVHRTSNKITIYN